MDIGGVTFGARYYATLRHSHLRISDSDGCHVLRLTTQVTRHSVAIARYSGKIGTPYHTLSFHAGVYPNAQILGSGGKHQCHCWAELLSSF